MTKNNFLCFAVVLFLGLGLGVTANFAYANNCAPGCPQEACEAANNHANAKEVESKAHTIQITPQSDNAPGMTCFDHAMGLTSRLGSLFSDVNPTGIIPVANSQVFGTSSFPDYGSATKLIKGLDAVVNPTIQGHATNFADSLSAAIGATVMGYMNEFVNTTIQPIIDSITGPLATLNGYVGTMNGYVTAVQTAMTAVGLAFPGTITGLVATLNAAWNTINSFISGAVAAITNIINGIVNMITAAINSVMTSLMGAAAADGSCSRIAQLWGNDEPDGFRSIIGSAIERGTPYFSMIQMLSGEIPDALGPAGPRLLQEIFNTSNAGIIANALDDLLPGGVLSGPGSSPWWPATPMFLPGATTQTIRNLMAAP